MTSTLLPSLARRRPIIGSTGCGKSTLVNLIPRLYDVTGGKITLDGKDIRNITMKDLRDEIGIVQQDVYLFAERSSTTSAMADRMRPTRSHPRSESGQCT